MKIMIFNLDMAYDRTTDLEEVQAEQIAEQFGVQVIMTGTTSPGTGYPTINVIGTTAALWKMLTTEGGWASGDVEDDAETAFLYLKEGVRVFG